MSHLNIRACLLASLVLVGSAATAQQISVTVDGKEVDFPGIGPQYMQGRVLVPLRGVFEQMGATVLWHPATRTVTADDGERSVKLKINSRTAWVNGDAVTLDVPAKIVKGSTVVPLRFLGEALRATVNWRNQNNLVEIITAGYTGTGRVQTNSQMRRFVTIDAGTVIPVRLDDELSSNNSRRGDAFTATIRQDDMASYAGIPWGAKIEGRVVTARAKRGNRPGLLELAFDRLKLPSGETYAINGSLIGLDSASVDRNANGVLVAKADKRDDRLVYAGVGAAGGLIIGILTKKPLEGTVLGGILGYLYGENKRRTDQSPDNVMLRPGTEFGVRLDSDVRVRETSP